MLQMVSETNPQNRPKPGRRIKGICADAEALGVTRMHLWAVLHGHRESKPLLSRYNALKLAQKKQPQKINARKFEKN